MLILIRLLGGKNGLGRVKVDLPSKRLSDRI